MMLVYVDDILIASTNDVVVQDLITQLRHLGAPKIFLGLEIARSQTGLYVN